MKNLKVMLPILAFFCAIVMSFASANSEEVQARDYVQLEDGSWLSINEVSCSGLGETCHVQFGENGPTYPVFDEMYDTQPKPSSTNVPVIINQ